MNKQFYVYKTISSVVTADDKEEAIKVFNEQYSYLEDVGEAEAKEIDD